MVSFISLIHMTAEPLPGSGFMNLLFTVLDRDTDTKGLGIRAMTSEAEPLGLDVFQVTAKGSPAQ